MFFGDAIVLSNSGVVFFCGSLCLGICGGKGSLSSWRFSEASGRLDFPGFTSTSRKGGGVQFHLWVGLLERPNCEPWQEWRCIPRGATRNAEISQVVSSKCLMGSCKAECRIFWNSLWNCLVSTTLGATTVWICWVFNCFCIPFSANMLSGNTHPGISVSGGKLWFAWSFARNASSVDEKRYASRQAVLNTWQCTQSWRLGFLVALLNVFVTVWKPAIHTAWQFILPSLWDGNANRAMLRHEPLQQFGCWSLQRQACNCDSNLCIICCTQLLSQTQFLDASRIQNYLQYRTPCTT